MVTSKTPVAAKPADQFISLIKAPDKKEVAAQKTVTKGSAEKKTEDISEKKASAASASTAKGTKAAKAAAKPSDNKKARIKKKADTEPTAKKTPKKTESPPADRPTSAWPFTSSPSSRLKS